MKYPKHKPLRLGGGPKGNKHAVGNRGGGRPCLYKPEFIDKLIAFFDIEPIKQEVYETAREWFKDEKGRDTNQLKKLSEKIRYIPNRLPTLFRFARSIGACYPTMHDWYRKGRGIFRNKEGNVLPPDLKFADFADAYEAAKEMQKEFLIILGLSGATPPSAYIFTAKNITDMRDRIENDLTSKGESLGVVYLPPKVPLPDE